MLSSCASQASGEALVSSSKSTSARFAASLNRRVDLPTFFADSGTHSCDKCSEINYSKNPVLGPSDDAVCLPRTYIYYTMRIFRLSRGHDKT